MPDDERSATVSIPMRREVAEHIVAYSPVLATRLHHLLDLNGDGLLNPAEQAEVEALVELAQVKQLLAMALEFGAR